MIAKELKRLLSDNEERENQRPPWWGRLTTIERALALRALTEEQVASFAEENREFRRAFARMGFAGHQQ